MLVTPGAYPRREHPKGLPIGFALALPSNSNKHLTIINYAFSVINKLEALLTDDARVVNFDRRVFIVQATDWKRCSRANPLAYWGSSSVMKERSFITKET